MRGTSLALLLAVPALGLLLAAGALVEEARARGEAGWPFTLAALGAGALAAACAVGALVLVVRRGRAG